MCVGRRGVLFYGEKPRPQLWRYFKEYFYSSWCQSPAGLSHDVPDWRWVRASRQNACLQSQSSKEYLSWSLLSMGWRQNWTERKRTILYSLLVVFHRPPRRWLSLSSDRQHLSYDVCLEVTELWCLSGGKREGYQNCSVLYCVLKLCTVISTLR